MDHLDARQTIETLIEAGDAIGAARLLSSAWERQPSAAFALFVEALRYRG